VRIRPLLLVSAATGLVALLVVAAGLLGIAASVGTGYAAKVTCSLAFNSGLDADWVLRRYVAHEIAPLQAALGVQVDAASRTVDATGFGVVHSRALHRPGLGCTLVADASEESLRAQSVRAARAARPDAARPWPEGSAPASEPPDPALEAALEEAFREPEGEDSERRRQTLAVVVVHRGRLVAERYAASVAPDTPLLSWSMAKSVLATLVGIAQADGLVSLSGPAPVAEWSDPGDPRHAISLDQLLRMSSGLAFDETYAALNDVSRMLFTRGDTGAFAAAMPPAHAPDGFWSYSSGTSNIVARSLRDAFGGDLDRQVAYARERLFEPVGMTTAFFEPDASGSFIGSSFVFASARDWARFGLLHLQDGVWQGRRILPEGWVAYVTRPTPAAPDGTYGAHWWLNAGDPRAPERRMWPSLPRDTYAARGHSGQFVVVVPSADLVVVRLGLTTVDVETLAGIEPLVASVIEAVSADRPTRDDTRS